MGKRSAVSFALQISILTNTPFMLIAPAYPAYDTSLCFFFGRSLEAARNLWLINTFMENGLHWCLILLLATIQEDVRLKDPAVFHCEHDHLYNHVVSPYITIHWLLVHLCTNQLKLTVPVLLGATGQLMKNARFWAGDSPGLRTVVQSGQWCPIRRSVFAMVAL